MPLLQVVLKLMVAAYLTSLIAQISTIIVTLLHILRQYLRVHSYCDDDSSQPPYPAGVTWSSIAGMCIASHSSRAIVAVWASPVSISHKRVAGTG